MYAHAISQIDEDESGGSNIDGIKRYCTLNVFKILSYAREYFCRFDA